MDSYLREPTVGVSNSELVLRIGEDCLHLRVARAGYMLGAYFLPVGALGFLVRSQTHIANGVRCASYDGGIDRGSWYDIAEAENGCGQDV
jgi:hypothetical protein